MKRCSQCGFTFEENEQVCDFDGTELTTVPEPIPFYQRVSPNVSTLSAVRRSRFRRLALSPVTLAVLALAGLISSALLIGYYDSGSRPNIEPNIDLASNAESRNDTVVVPQGPAKASAQVKPDQVAKPRSISTQRRITSASKASMPSSMLRWESASHSSRSRPGPSTHKREATTASGTRASKPRSERTKRQSLARGRRRGYPAAALARKQKKPGSSAGQLGRGGMGSTKSNRESQAKNHTRPRSHNRVLRWHSAVEVAKQRPGRESESLRLQKESKAVAISRGRESQSSHEQKESKFVAILKKTGSILTKPFKF